LIKTKHFRILLIACILGLASESSFSQAWRQIQPLHTSRRQVRRLLGLPKVLGDIDRYEFEKEWVDVSYVKWSCKFDPDGWRVPVGTVSTVHVKLKTPLKLTATQWDLSKFKREPGDFDNPSSAQLVDEEDGVILNVYGDTLASYSYVPKTKDESKRCAGYSVAKGQPDQRCLQLVFNIACSSDQIRFGQTVSCRAVFIAGQPIPVTPPSIDWSVSSNASFSRQGEEIKISLKNPSHQPVAVNAKATGPRVCDSSTRTELATPREKSWRQSVNDRPIARPARHRLQTRGTAKTGSGLRFCDSLNCDCLHPFSNWCVVHGESQESQA
jgi:hypothetical protein